MSETFEYSSEKFHFVPCSIEQSPESLLNLEDGTPVSEEQSGGCKSFAELTAVLRVCGSTLERYGVVAWQREGTTARLD